MLCDGNKNFYFLEMNTRLQVYHDYLHWNIIPFVSLIFNLPLGWTSNHWTYYWGRFSWTYVKNCCWWKITTTIYWFSSCSLQWVTKFTIYYYLYSYFNIVICYIQFIDMLLKHVFMLKIHFVISFHQLVCYTCFPFFFSFFFHSK